MAHRFELKEISLTVNAEAQKFLAREGYDPHYGARPLKRYIQTHILNPLSEHIVGNKVKEGDAVRVEVRDGRLVLELDKKKQKRTVSKKEEEAVVGAGV